MYKALFILWFYVSGKIYAYEDRIAQKLMDAGLFWPFKVSVYINSEKLLILTCVVYSCHFLYRIKD